MLKNLRRKNQEKDRVNADFYKYERVCEHGYLHKPSAIAYSSDLNLLAIGTRDGRIKVFGKPGVESEAQTSDTTCIQQLIFLENNQLVSVCDDGDQNSLHLWKIDLPMVELKACTLEGRLKKISMCCLSRSRECLYIGTEGGHIYILDLNVFELRDHVIYQDIVMKNLPGNVMSNGGPVEDIKEHPLDNEKILIGYRKGLIVLWNQDKIKIESYFVAKQYVESVFWHSDCKGFISAQENGSLCLWSLPDSEDDECGIMQEQSTPFGPFPCKSILKVEWYDPVIIFSGGLPRASYSDKHCISVLEDNSVQAVLDFTSKVVDFVVIKEATDTVPSVLMVLCEEEIVVIDLTAVEKNFPTYMKPYLACIHSSNVNTSAHISNCPHDLWNILKTAGQNECTSGLSNKDWPVTGGIFTCESTIEKDILITGHDDGTVKFWDTSQHMFNRLCTIHTSKLFQEYEGPPPEDPDDDWPPFKKVCSFDPYADDSRFVIQKIVMCCVTKTLLIGGSGGQVILYNLGVSAHEEELLKVHDINVLEDLKGFEWKGKGPLTLATDNDDKSVFRPITLLQIRPSAPITAMSMDTASSLIAFGTCHGFVMYDMISSRVALVKCTVNPTDLANTGAGIQRKRTITKSLRDSFRRLRSRRKSTKQRETSVKVLQSVDGIQEVSSQARLVDASRVEEDVMSMVRCLYFGETFLGDATSPCLTLWAGTNAGYIYVYTVIIPEEGNKSDTEIKTQVGKELKLKHHAPVINIMAMDKDGIPIGPRTDREAGRLMAPDMTCGHSVLILSEEQLKIFALPTLRYKTKVKLTAIDGSRLRKSELVQIQIKTEGAFHSLVCLTNLGDVIAYSLPSLKQEFKVNIVRREDVRAKTSLLLTYYGELFFLKSPSALQRSCIVTRLLGNVKSTIGFDVQMSANGVEQMTIPQ